MGRFASWIAAAALIATPLEAQTAPAPGTPPRLVVVISVDQFSADLFAEYRNRFTGGFARLLDGQVFPSGFQSHAATETCPGHSTILTGFRPEHTGIIANTWVDQHTPSSDPMVYCAEDETLPGATSEHYTVTDRHLMVPALGERMKAANAASRVVSVAGKDRAAVMMGGHVTDQIWWWDGSNFVSYAGRTAPPTVAAVNTETNARIAEAQPAMAEPDFCRPHDRAVQVGSQQVGAGRFARAAGDRPHFRASPELDNAILALASGMVRDLHLGQGSAPDLLAVGLSATDYVGHAYGTEGNEMCVHLASLDRALGEFFRLLDATGVDYQLVLTADHGGHDIPERNDQHAMPDDQRIDAALGVTQMGAAIGRDLHLAGPVLLGSPNGDVWIDAHLTPADRGRVLAEAVRRYRASPQVAAVFTRADLLAAPPPVGPADGWSLLERAKASFYAARSGDFIVATRPGVVGIAAPGPMYVATHGSFANYDRRVPILFWRRGTTGFEQPQAIESVDIMPTLAGVLHLPLTAPLPDGRCLDLDEGPGTTCPAIPATP